VWKSLVIVVVFDDVVVLLGIVTVEKVVVVVVLVEKAMVVGATNVDNIQTNDVKENFILVSNTEIFGRKIL
jgi:hypothetical protein